MIQITTYEPASGRIAQMMTLKDDAEADQNGIWIEGHWDGREYYVLNGEPTERPGTGLPETHTIAANTDWIVPNIPQDTVVYVDDEDVGTVGTGDLILSFEFPATYSVRLEPPFPWKPATCEVTVT